jgi:hypothetical protein
MTDEQLEPREDWFLLPVPAPGPTRYEELGLRPDATADEVRVATARKVRALKNAGATEQELADLNATALTSVDRRAAYDEANPPCAVLRLEPAWSAFFDEPEIALARVRRDLETFLLRSDGDRPIAFPRRTDLRHSDFSADFRFTPLLDRKDTA